MRGALRSARGAAAAAVPRWLTTGTGFVPRPVYMYTAEAGRDDPGPRKLAGNTHENQSDAYRV